MSLHILTMTDSEGTLLRFELRAGHDVDDPELNIEIGAGPAYRFDLTTPGPGMTRTLDDITSFVNRAKRANVDIRQAFAEKGLRAAPSPQATVDYVDYPPPA